MAFILLNLRKRVFPGGTFDKTIDLPFENLAFQHLKNLILFWRNFMEIIWPYHQKKNASTVMNFTLINWRIRMQYLEKKKLKKFN